jgi:hypothetical protein
MALIGSIQPLTAGCDHQWWRKPHSDSLARMAAPKFVGPTLELNQG